MRNANYFDDGAILCPTTECVDEVNECTLCLMNGKEVTYLSSDTPCPFDEQGDIQVKWFA